MEGFLVIDKPAGITSHDVVAAVRAVTGVKKVGHTGTLDPFATGVLPLALGRCTRLIQYLDESIKVYDAVVKLGEATDTGDPTGEVIRTAPLPEHDADGVREVLESFLGEQDQTPPAYSAVKVKGKPLYSYARKGQKVEVKSRRITIHSLELGAYEGDRMELRITCSRGTYARVLADDIAIALGSAGHLSALSRARSGPFFLEDGLSMPRLSEMVARDEGHTWNEVLLAPKGGPRIPWAPRDEVRDALRPHVRTPIQALSHLPLVDVGSETAERIKRGGPLPVGPAGEGTRYLVVQADRLIAVGEMSPKGPKALRVL